MVKEDRKRFSRCLIRGLPYSGDDEKSFLSLCQFQLNLDLGLVAKSIVSLTRVGNTGCLKPRVLIIKLNCRNTRKNILRNSYKLKNFISSAGTNVFVSPDFSRAQLLINSRNKQRRCSRERIFMSQHSCESSTISDPIWKKYSHQPENSSWSGFSADLEIPKSPPKSAEICCGFANFEKSCANPQRAADLKEQHSQIRRKLHLYMKMQIRGILLWIIPIQRKFLSSKKFFRLAIRDYAMGTSWQSMSITSLAPSAVV